MRVREYEVPRVGWGWRRRLSSISVNTTPPAHRSSDRIGLLLGETAGTGSSETALRDPVGANAGRERVASDSAHQRRWCHVRNRGMQTGFGYCWGQGGLIGDGTLSQRSTPTLVGSGPSGSAVSARADSGVRDRGETGLVYCWGIEPERGGLGDGGRGLAETRLMPALVADGRRFSASTWISSHLRNRGRDRSRVLLGEEYGFGQVGDGTTTDRMVPTIVGGETAASAESSRWRSGVRNRDADE